VLGLVLVSLPLRLVAASPREPSPAPPSVERSIEGAPEGRIAVALDAGVYEDARPDLGDLRIVDDTGAAVPYLLDLDSLRETAETRRPEILNRSFVRGRSSSVTLNFAERLPRRELGLSLSGDNFRRRVQVEGSDDGRRWDVLVDTAYVFAVPPPNPARYESLTLPENDQPRLRVTVYADADDPSRIEIQDVFVRVTSGRRRESARSLSPVVVQDEAARETWLTLDLGARHQPFHALTLDVADPQFFRGVQVEARRDPGSSSRKAAPAPIQWVSLGEGALYRYPSGAGTRENLRLEVAGRERVLRLRIRNRDDRPLSVRGATVTVPLERLVFEAAAGRRYRLTYGSATTQAPAYDLARTVADVEQWSAAAREVRLGAATRRASAGARIPWTERHPLLIWIGLLAVVAVLSLVTWRALRAAA
jgi:hypothetical protein